MTPIGLQFPDLSVSLLQGLRSNSKSCAPPAERPAAPSRNRIDEAVYSG